jgi:DNA modification methylase
MDVRQTHTLNFREARDEKDEKHVCPLQLDTIARAVTLWSNPGEVVLSPFMGVGSEVYGAVKLGRRGIGVELKPSYFRQAVKNLKSLEVVKQHETTGSLFE